MAKSLSLPELIGERGLRWPGLSLATLPAWASWLLLPAVALVALVLNAWGLSEAGYGNTYYAAATRSMTLSWKNFFFGSFDPGGFITVDKPPLFLWFDALSARLFGYSSWSLLLPSAIAGSLSVALVWLIVRRYFGTVAATAAALVLALTPISVAVDRLNLPEPFYILALVGAAGATLLSLERRNWWAWTILAGALVGLAFNAKMLAAWIPGPALALAIVVGVQGPWRGLWKQWLMRLTLLAAATFIVSGSWMTIVDAWPKSDRPYVGGSTDNSVYQLALGYNGLNRLEGIAQGFGGRRNNNARPPTGGQTAPNNGGRGGQPQPGQGFGFNRGGTPPTQPGGNPTTPQNPNGGRVPGNSTPGFGGGPGNSTTPGNGFGGQNNQTPAGGNAVNGPGGVIAGAPSVLRMFDAANGGQIAWFLPFAVLGGLLALWRWRGDRLRLAAVVLWLGWVGLFAGTFSYTQGIYHSYYTSALAPGIAALAGIGLVASADLIRRHFAWLLPVAALALVTVWVQLVVAGRFPDFFAWVRPISVIVVLAGIGLLVVSLSRRLPATAGLAVIVAGLLLLPAAWSSYETAHASLNTTLPQAGPRQGLAGQTFGSNAFDNGTAQLAAWLQSHSDSDARWDLAVSSAMQASTLIAEYHLSVMALGGFLGSDPTISATQFGDLVANGEIRYVLVGGAAPGRGSASNSGAGSEALGSGPVMSAVQSSCKRVTDTTVPSQYRNSLYDCSDWAVSLQAQP